MGQRNKYPWRVGEPPPDIDQHTVVKHSTIRAYIERYIEKVTENPHTKKLRITIVDGFCGGGVYYDQFKKRESLGSPFQILEAVENTRQKVITRRMESGFRNAELQIDAKYFFNDVDQFAVEFLRKELVSRGYKEALDKETIVLLNQEFAEIVPTIIRGVRDFHGNRSTFRSLFLVDPCGYTQCKPKDIQAILGGLPGAEILISFFVDYLIDYLSGDEKYRKAFQSSGLSDYVDLGELMHTKNNQIEWKRIIQLELTRVTKIAYGAKYYTPFFLKSNTSHKTYWLIHLSGHHAARNEMVDIHWSHESVGVDFEHFGAGGITMLGYDPKNDLTLTDKYGQQSIFKSQKHLKFGKNLAEEMDNILLEQLAEYLWDYKVPTTYEKLFDAVCNGTPATDEQIKSTIADLASRNTIEITTNEGGQRRKSHRITRNDNIIISPQKKLFI